MFENILLILMYPLWQSDTIYSIAVGSLALDTVYRVWLCWWFCNIQYCGIKLYFENNHVSDCDTDEGLNLAHSSDRTDSLTETVKRGVVT